MPDVQILAPGTHPSPLDYVVPGAQEILIKALAAQFDGTSAAGAYVPSVELIAPGGIVAATCPLASSVAAGSSADVSWFPLSGVGVSNVTGQAIQFDKDPQTGTFLSVTTTGTDPFSGNGFDLFTTKAQNFQTLDDFDVTVGGGENHAVGGDFRVNPAGNCAFLGVNFLLESSTFVCQSPAITFFNAAPVGQQATPVTLGDVIALLQAYGLSA